MAVPGQDREGVEESMGASLLASQVDSEYMHSEGPLRDLGAKMKEEKRHSRHAGTLSNQAFPPAG